MSHNPTNVRTRRDLYDQDMYAVMLESEWSEKIFCGQMIPGDAR